MAKPDWIAPVEAAYELAGDSETWLKRILAACAPLLDRGHGLVGLLVSLRGGVGVLADCATGDEHLLEVQRASFAMTTPGVVPRLLQTTVFSNSQHVFPFVEGSEQTFFESTGRRFRDAAGFLATTATGVACTLHAPSTEFCRPAALEKRRWSCAAAHLGAGLRLRLALAEMQVPPTAEAVLDPSARLLDWVGPAHSTQALDSLREAVKNRERARTRRERSDPDHALSLWEGLVAGRWSLIDRFESDGKRFVVAHRNDPELGDPRGLSRRERQIAEYVGHGRSFKEIAYLLGISASAVSNSAARAIAKLGLESRAELASFFAAGASASRSRRSSLQARSSRRGRRLCSKRPRSRSSARPSARLRSTLRGASRSSRSPHGAAPRR